MLNMMINVRGLATVIKKINLMNTKTKRTLVRAVNDGAIIIEAEMKEHSPVKTSYMQKKITHSKPEVSFDGKTIMSNVGSNVEYMAAVEFGYKKGKKARTEKNPNATIPFMYPALRDKYPVVKRMIYKVIAKLYR